MGYITSGNQIVDAMGMMNISGNVISQIWYSTITRPNGKPYLLAITLLSDIVYWYRPAEERDEQSGRVIGWKKRFKGDLLQKTLTEQQIISCFGYWLVFCLEYIKCVCGLFREIMGYPAELAYLLLTVLSEV